MTEYNHPQTTFRERSSERIVFSRAAINTEANLAKGLAKEISKTADLKESRGETVIVVLSKR